MPTVPLTDLYNAASDYIQERGGEVRFRAGVESFRAEFAGVKLMMASGANGHDHDETQKL